MIFQNENKIQKFVKLKDDARLDNHNSYIRKEFEVNSFLVLEEKNGILTLSNNGRVIKTCSRYFEETNENLEDLKYP